MKAARTLEATPRRTLCLYPLIASHGRFPGSESSGLHSHWSIFASHTISSAGVDRSFGFSIGEHQSRRQRRVQAVVLPRTSSRHAFAAGYVVGAASRLVSVAVTASSDTYGVCRWTGSDFRRTRRLIDSTKSENAIAK